MFLIVLFCLRRWNADICLHHQILLLKSKMCYSVCPCNKFKRSIRTQRKLSHMGTTFSSYTAFSNLLLGCQPILPALVYVKICARVHVDLHFNVSSGPYRQQLNAMWDIKHLHLLIACFVVVNVFISPLHPQNSLNLFEHSNIVGGGIFVHCVILSLPMKYGYLHTPSNSTAQIWNVLFSISFMIFNCQYIFFDLVFWILYYYCCLLGHFNITFT